MSFGSCISGSKVEKKKPWREQQNIEWYFYNTSPDTASPHVLLPQLNTVEYFSFEFPV